MPGPLVAAVSRTFASTVSIVFGEPTARDQVVWLAAMAPMLVGGERLKDPDESDADLMALRDRLLIRPSMPVIHRAVDLADVAGVERLVRLRPFIERLQGSSVGVGKQAYPMIQGWATLNEDRTGFEKRPPARGHERVGVGFHGTVLGAAHIANDICKGEEPIVVDLAAMKAFRCRYTPVIYLRILSWIAGGVPLPRGVRRRTTPNGGVRVTVPYRASGALLGAPHMRMRRDLEQLLLRPVCSDLERMGVRLTANFRVEPGYERVYQELELTVGTKAMAAPPKRVPKRKLTPRSPAPADLVLPF